MSTPLIRVEVAYGTLSAQSVVPMDVQEPMTVEMAILNSGLLKRFPEIDLRVNKVGIHSKVATLDTLVQQGDRVEIYRPLIADPKEARRKRAAEGKPLKKGT